MFYPFPITGPRVALLHAAGQGGHFIFCPPPPPLWMRRGLAHCSTKPFSSLLAMHHCVHQPLLDNTFYWCQPNGVNNQTNLITNLIFIAFSQTQASIGQLEDISLQSDLRDILLSQNHLWILICRRIPSDWFSFNIKFQKLQDKKNWSGDVACCAAVVYEAWSHDMILSTFYISDFPS